MIVGGNKSRQISFRAEEASDEEVVRRAHVAHRITLFVDAGWPADALTRLCEQQHTFQELHIATYNPLAEKRMIVVEGAAVGRLCLDRTMTPWRIVDVVLLPEAQGSGLGSAAIQDVLAEAAAAGAMIDLMVGCDNARAEALYRRLGFVDTIDDLSATHRRLVWRP